MPPRRPAARPFAVASAAFLTLAQLAAAPARAQTQPIDSLVRAFLARHDIPSAAIAVVKDGRIVAQAGYGIADRARGTPATDSTVYDIGSISKQFAAEAIMLLVEDGKLSLDDPLSKFLAVPAAWAPITIGHVLSHTSGLHDWDGRPDFSYAADYSASEYIALVARFPLDFPPGTRFAYTNAGFPLLGLVVDSVARMPYEAFVARRIFTPAGMTATRFKHTDDHVPNRADGWVDSAGALRPGETRRPRVIAPSGGVISTAGDMARWVIALEAGRIVSAASLQRMQQPVTLASGRTFSAGLAWFLDDFRGHRVLLHNGSTVGGFSSVVYRYPDDRLAVVVLFAVDRFNAVNALATRVASGYGVPLWAGAFEERADADPALGRQLVAMLAAVAEKRDTELLGPNLRNPGASSRANPAFGFSGTVDRFALLDHEDVGSAGREHFGNVIRHIYRYKLVAGARTIYYTIELSPEGKVVRFVPEEE